MNLQQILDAMVQAALAAGLVSPFVAFALFLAVALLVVMHQINPAAPARDGEGLSTTGNAPPIPMPPGGAVLDQHPDPDVATKG